jgi:SET domain-containing protein
VIGSSKFERNVEVKATEVGFGVFSRRSFKKEAIVGEITGDIMSSDFESDYCMHLDDLSVLEPSHPFRFLNHSCVPNCELVIWKHRKIDGRKVPRLWLSVIRKVKKGQELTIDYAWPAEFAIPCRCRADKCRKWIVDPDELSELKSMRRKGKMQRSS